jgi:CelD/BcsL family acetyltransferase involved in cellulose biosynthesis
MIEIIRDPIEIESLANVWDDLADHFKTPLLRSEWFDACAKAFCQPGQLRVLINKSRRGIDAIAALVLVQKRGLGRLELLGTSFLFEPSGFIYKDNEALEELMNSIIKMKKPVMLSRLRSESAEAFMLREMSKKRSLCMMSNGPEAPFLPITTGWTEFEANMSSRRSQDFRRARRQAEKLGKVQFEIVSPNPEILDHYLEEIFKVEAAGWKGRKGTAMLFDERLKHFFYLYSKAASRLGTLRLGFLRINNQPAAVLLAVECFNRFWALKVGYDEAFSRCSPGILLMHETIHHAFKNGLEAYEFLGSDAPWMHIWTNQINSYVTAHIYPFSIKGQLGLGIDVASSITSRVLKMVGK